MTIREVCEKFGITPDTLRYYEKEGVIPPVPRNKSGNRDYDDSAVRWVEIAVYMRDAGVSVEKIAEYVRLYQRGDETFEERKTLLVDARTRIQESMKKYEHALERLNYKIEVYDDAIRTGKLSWDK